MSMTLRPSERLLGAPLAVALLLVGCGTDTSSGASVTTIDLSETGTTYAEKPPATTTTVPEGVVDDGTSAAAQEYVIQAGDYPLKVASQFGIELADLVAFNSWASADEFPFPGTTIKIPPGARIDGQTPTTPSTDPATPVGDSIPPAGDNCGEGSHTVVSGDYPLKVAQLYDVTIESLNAANAGNPAYQQFVPGQTIIIPAKADC